jgi:hypothetical protein
LGGLPRPFGEWELAAVDDDEEGGKDGGGGGLRAGSSIILLHARVDKFCLPPDFARKIACMHLLA